jgi:hypothetical protein
VCEGANVSTPYMLGEGPALNVYTGWANDYPRLDYSFKYFSADDASVYSDLESGTAFAFDPFIFANVSLAPTQVLSRSGRPIPQRRAPQRGRGLRWPPPRPLAIPSAPHTTYP